MSIWLQKQTRKSETNVDAGQQVSAPDSISAATTASVGAEVGELQVDADVLAAEQGHDLLQGVAVLADDADRVALDAGLRLLLRVLDRRDDHLGLLGRDALHQLDLLPHAGVGGRLDLLVLEVLQRDAALDQLLRQDLDDRLQLVLVLARELNRVVAFELDLGLRVLQVEAGVDLFGGLVDRVLHFLKLYFADYVEAVIGCHMCLPRKCWSLWRSLLCQRLGRLSECWGRDF